MLDEKTNQELAKRYEMTTKPTHQAVQRFITEILKMLRCQKESCKTICIFLIIYLERMIEAFEGLTLDDFEISPDVSPMGHTTTNYTNKTSPNTVSS